MAWDRAVSASSHRWLVSMLQVLKVERKPCTVAVVARPVSRRIFVRLMSESGLEGLTGDGKMRFEGLRYVWASLRVSTACWLRGIRCSRFIFMRWAGIVHVSVSKLISFHVASLVSPERVAVRISRRRASLVMGEAGESVMVRRAAGVSW